jgi:hypothetical protein
MTSRTEHRTFVAAAFALWLLFFVQAVNTPVVLDDWFQLRYWRDHEFGLGSLWAYARHNYFHYNPRLGEVLLAIVDGSQLVHLIVTPLVQLAVLPIVFAIAFARWPRATLRDLQLLLFIQTMIWLVIPIPGIMYFYRPFATNYLWGFTITLALFVPYRLALAGRSTQPRLWLVPVMLVLGWAAGMCNEHTGPTAMVAMAGFIYVAWRWRRLRAWMIAGMVGLYVGYPMLFFAPGQSVRYGGLATRETPTKLLADRGVIGCLEILRDFVFESRLAIVLFVAAVVRYLWTLYLRRASFALPPRRALVASGAVFYASGVLLVAAFAVGAQYLFSERVVRRFVVVTCTLVCAFHAVRFVEVYAVSKVENDARLERLRTAPPGTTVVIQPYSRRERSRWEFGDDFVQHEGWLGDYVGRELYDLRGVEVGRGRRRHPRLAASLVYSPPRDEPAPSIAHLPTYRQLQTPAGKVLLSAQIASEVRKGLARFTVRAIDVFDHPQHRPMIVIDWTRDGYSFVDGRPYDDSRGHFIRVRAATVPKHLDSTYMVGCNMIDRVEPIVEGPGADVLIPVDERQCRGPFTAVMCEPTRCWVAGWY